MNYVVYDEEGKMIRSFQRKSEAVAFLQVGWTIKRIMRRDGYSESIDILGESPL